MITQEQQQAWADYQKTSGFAPKTANKTTTYDAIDSIIAQKQAPQQPEAPPRLGQGPAGEFSKGVVKAVASPLIRVGGMIQNALTGGKGGQGANQVAEQIDTQPSTGMSEDVGKVVGTVAPYFTGAGEAGFAEKIGAFIPKLAESLGMKAEGLLPKIASFLAKKAPAVAENTAIGTAQTGDLQQGVETGVGGEVLAGAGKALSGVAKGTYKALSVPLSAREANILQAYKAKVPFTDRMEAVVGGASKAPNTAANTAFKNGFWGTESMIGTQARKAKQGLWDDVISPALKRSQTPVDMPALFKEAETNIVKNTPELGDQNARLEALKAIQEEYQAKPTATMEELQHFKEGWASHVPEKSYNGKDITQTYNNVRAELADAAREKIYGDLGPEAKQAYFDYGNLKSIAEWGQKAMTGGKFKGGAGSFISAMKDAVLTPIATVAGHAVYKTGEGIEFIGPPGARYLSDLFNEESQTSQPR